MTQKEKEVKIEIINPKKIIFDKDVEKALLTLYECEKNKKKVKELEKQLKLANDIIEAKSLTEIFKQVKDMTEKLNQIKDIINNHIKGYNLKELQNGRVPDILYDIKKVLEGD